MGLDTTYNCWHGAYSAFSSWRHEIAKAAGYQVLKVKYEDGMTMDCIMLDWGHVAEKNYMGEWDVTPPDPLHVLFIHSDCEGSIYPEQAAPLADALERLLPVLRDRGVAAGHVARTGGHAGMTERFITGLRAAVIAGEPVEFY